MTRFAPPFLLMLLLAACSGTKPVMTGAARGGFGVDQHLPGYVRNPYEPFSRINAVAIAEREWRAFGSLVNDDPPDQPLPHAARPDQQPGLWQRVADYWWFSQDYGAPQGLWTSKYTEGGTPYSGDPPAWSAAFISYVMRVSGAGTGFPYTPIHADYINAAARNEGVLRAQRPTAYAPLPGDLICTSRGRRVPLVFDDLPMGRFFGHCDIVVGVVPGQLQVIGGNVAAGVTMKHVPVTQDGMLATPDGQVLDSRYPWFVVIRVLYADAPLATMAPASGVPTPVSAPGPVGPAAPIVLGPPS